MKKSPVSTFVINSPSTQVQAICPLADNRWDRFVRECKSSSVFHTRGWLEALYRTYGYEPVIFSASSEGSAIQNSIPFCRVDSWLTGRRLVSLPFSDHCDVLISDPGAAEALFAALEQQLTREKLRYVEIRSRVPVNTRRPWQRLDEAYYLHQLDLEPRLSALFNNCHKDSTQRKIRRAEREGLRYEEGQSTSHLNTFYELLFLTRKRHQVPPQPRKWFANLAISMGDALKVRVAFKNNEPAAAILTLRHGDTLLCKYACSDARFHPSGAMHFLIWRAIQEAKQEGLGVFDFGRSAMSNQGLVTFKDRWGCRRSNITYSRYLGPGHGFERVRNDPRLERLARRVVSFLPDRAFRAVGEVFYKHIG